MAHIMYKETPQRKIAQRWHKLLNNGYRYVLIDSNYEVKAVARYEYELAALKTKQPLLKQITISEQI